MAILLAVLCLALAAGCSTGTRWDHRSDEHIVRRGETLYAIAFRYGLEVRDLARWNRLGDGSLIFPGQLLRLSPPRGAQTQPRQAAPSKSPPARPLPSIREQAPPAWNWPARGRINVEFGGKPGPGTGVLINGQAGQAIYAAASGSVVYAGSGLIGYGQLIILKHNDTYLSAYGYNASLLVTEGQSIARGEKIATMGEGPERKPRLHFEIRRNGKPVNPRQHLPAR